MTNDPHHDPLGHEGALPAPGWYADPERPGQHRWWDGQQWTQAMLAPDVAGSSTGSGLEPVGPWLTSVMDIIRERAGHLFTLVAVISLPVALVSGLLTWQAMKGLTIATDTADGSFEFFGFDAQTGYLLAGSFLLSTLSGLVLAAAIVHQAGHAKAGTAVPWSDSLAHAALRLPRVLGAFLGLVVIYLILGFIAAVLIGLGAAAGGAGLAVVGVLLFLVAALFVGVRLSLVSTGAAVAPRGVSSFSSSWKLTSGRFWAMTGRLCLLLVLLIGIQLTGSIVTAPITGSFGNQIDPEASIIVVADLFGASNAPLFLALQVVSALLGGLTSAIWGVGLFFLYRALGGRIAPELGIEEISGADPALPN